MAANNKGWREPWEDPLPEMKPIQRLKTDYKTPFDIPGVAAPLPGAQMTSRLKALKARTGSDMEGQAFHYQYHAGTQPGFNQEVDPNWPTHPTNDDGDRTGIGAKYVVAEWEKGKSLKRIQREAKKKGWTIGPKAQEIFDGKVPLK